MFYKISFAALFSLAINISYARTQLKKCHHECHVFSLDQQKPDVLVTPDQFRLFVESEHHERQACVGKKELKGEIVIFEVNDFVSNEVVLSIRIGARLIASSSFGGPYGSLSAYSKGLRLSCSRSIE